MKAHLTSIALGLLMTSSVPAEPWIELHAGSKHGESTYYDLRGHKQEYNETNLGLGIMFPVNQHLEVGAGFFKNSYNINTLYTGFDIHTTDRAPVRYGLSVALVDGYQDTPTPTRVMVLPNLTMGNEHIRLKIGIIPIGVPLVTLTVGFRF